MTREEERIDRGIDVLIEFKKKQCLFEVVRIEQEISKIVGKQVPESFEYCFGKNEEWLTFEKLKERI